MLPRLDEDTSFRPLGRFHGLFRTPRAGVYQVGQVEGPTGARCVKN